MIIDDMAGDAFVARIGTRWRGVSDRVMGGVSQESVTVEHLHGRRCLRLRGEVSLDNNGGFIQMALDLAGPGGTLDASGFSGIRLLTWGNGERYSLRLRTPDATRPWQSYRAGFQALPQWREVYLPFADFQPHRLSQPLDISRLRRLGVVAIGREFYADVAVCEIGLYPD